MSELAVRQGGPPDELSIEEMVDQVQKVQMLMREVMQEDQHYGVIPGTDRPTLLKPGAEKLCLMFRLDPEYEIMAATETDKLVSYTARCKLVHITTGLTWGTGLGQCNSKENKYRYRWIPTDERPDKPAADAMKAAGQGGWRKRNDKWVWHRKVDNDNAMELANTILKMATKRALVAAVLNATAASDIFTQDLDDLDPRKPSDGPQIAPRASQEVADTVERRRQELAEYAEDMWGEVVYSRNLAARFGVMYTEDLTEEQAVAVMQGMNTWAEANPKPDADLTPEPDEPKEEKEEEDEVVEPDIVEEPPPETPTSVGDEASE